jgi:hypothetical protein
VEVLDRGCRIQEEWECPDRACFSYPTCCLKFDPHRWSRLRLLSSLDARHRVPTTLLCLRRHPNALFHVPAPSSFHQRRRRHFSSRSPHTSTSQYCITLPVMSLERAYEESELKCVVWIAALLVLVIHSKFSHWQASHASPAFGARPWPN